VAFVSFVVSARSASVVSARSATPQQAPAFRSGVDLVNLGVTVTDKKGALVTDLTADDFEVIEDGKKQTVTYFATGAVGAPGPEMHLGLLLDVSQSMGEDIRFTRTAAIKFLNTLTSAVDITIVDFDSQVRVARYEQAEFARVVERIRQQKVSGETALYDAIGVYLDGAAGQNGRKIMLLYTDGGDTRSALRLKDLLNLLKASDVTVYAIGELEHRSSTGKNDATSILRQVGEATGGQAFFPSSVRELDAVYDKVLAEIRAQYTVGYQSTNPATDGAWRKVEIRIARPNVGEYRVRSRKGYYGPYKK
jgi:Ca-activated chloride channel family protein